MPRTLIYILALICCTGNAFSQTAGVNSDFELLIQQLSDNYNVKIGYAADLSSITVPDIDEKDLNNRSITELLDLYFSRDGLTYRMVDGNKILLRKESIQLYQEATKLLTGTILDNATKEPLPYASIYVNRSTYGTMSDNNGRFSIEVEEGVGSELIVSYLGFKSRNLNCDLLAEDEIINMIPSEEILDEVTIIVDPMVIIDIGKNNQISFDKNRLVEINAGEIYGSDILRSIQMLPGVSNDADAAGKIQLRGSDAEETLVMMDGIPLFKTDHYYGIFGAINPYYIEEATLYKNKIPLEYENRAGGMLMLNSTDEFTSTHGNIELDFLKVNAYLELPITERVGLLLGGRINHTDPFNSPLASNDENVDFENALIENARIDRKRIIDVQPTFNFRDLNAKLLLDLTPKLSLSLAGYTSSDEYNRGYDIQYIIENRDGNKRQIAETADNVEEWQNGGVNLSGEYKFQSGRALKWSLFGSEFQNDYKLNLDLSRVLRIGEIEFYNYENINRNAIKTGGLRLQYVDDKEWHLGISLQNRENEISIVEGNKTPIDRNQEFNEGAVFGKKTFHPTEGLELGIGMRVNLLQAFDTINISPLIEMKYETGSGLYLKASYAKLYQNFRELTFENRFGGYQQYFVLAQEGLYPLGFSNLYMVGGGFTKGALKLDVEFFRKNLGGTISLLPVNPGLQNSVVPNNNIKLKLFTGESVSRGVDLYLGYDTPSFFSQLAYTYSKTEDTFEGINKGEPFPSQNDRRHQLKWLNAWTIGDFTISGSSVYSSGRPYISFDLLREAGGTRNRFEEALLNLPDYVRFDVGLKYETRISGLDAYVKGSVYNLLNRQNVKFIQQTFSVPVDTGSEDEVIIGSESSLVDRLINFTLGINF